jgi:hypothetical protein
MRWLVLVLTLIGCERMTESHPKFQGNARVQLNRIACAWDERHHICVCGIALGAELGQEWALFSESLFSAPEHACRK